MTAETLAERLAAECDRYGLPHDLDVLLRHIYANHGFRHDADNRTIEILSGRLAHIDGAWRAAQRDHEDSRAGVMRRWEDALNWRPSSDVPQATPRYAVAETAVAVLYEFAMAAGPIDGRYATSALAEAGVLDDVSRIVSPHFDQADAFEPGEG